MAQTISVLMKLHNTENREVLLKRMRDSDEARRTISFYKYHFVGNPQVFRDHLYLLLNSFNVLGRVYVAQEGINAQISVPAERLEAFKEALYDNITFLKNIRLNYAVQDSGKSFFKLKVKVRKKIVADGIHDPAFDPSDCGIHIDAVEYNRLSEKENTIIVDMRNHYESEVGHMKNAILPDATTFRESLPLVVEKLQNHKDKNIIMYCTGGIRCEKASAFLKYKGFKNVYQLAGGIIEYARQVKQLGIENKFIGKNFVFDERLGEKITDDVISHCHQCGAACDTHTNCANDQCHILFIQCPACAEKYNHCCSLRCADFAALSESEKLLVKNKVEFNGSKFSKGRYKALGLNEHLSLH